MSEEWPQRHVRREPLLADLFVGTVIALGCVVLALWGPRQLPSPVLFAVLLAASALASTLRLRLPLGSASSNLSVSCSVDFAALLLMGTAPTMLIAGTSAWLQSTLGHDRPTPLLRSAFNAAALVITVQAAGSTMVFFGGRPGSLDGIALPLLTGAIVYFLVNTALVAVAVGLSNRKPVWTDWQSNFLWTAPSYFVGAGAAAAAVAIWHTRQWWLLPVAAAPVYLTFRSYRMYLDRLTDERRHREEVHQLHRDATDALEAARHSEQRYALAATGANDGLWDWAIELDTFYCSDRWKRMIGLPADATVSTVEGWLAHVEDADRPALADALEAHRASDRSLFEHEYRMRHVDGSSRWVLCRGIAVRDQAGQATRMAGSQTDISEQRHIRETLALAAQHDPLTNLPNRTLFRELVQRAIAQGTRSAASRYAVLFIDLDGFKQVNDTHGHVAGDRFLTAVAARLQSELRPGDSLARLGGDEFGVLAESLNGPGDLSSIADRLLGALSDPFHVDTLELRASASIGIVFGTAQYRSVDALLRDADIAMYRAKAAGRGRYELFDPAMHASALKRLTVHSELRHAIERQEFIVLYQPIVELPSSRICGLEALVRWARADGRMVLPADFLGPLEETGLIVPLTYHVLRQACHQVAAWQQIFERPLDLSVNISPRLFTRPEFIDAVQAAIADSGILPGSLRLEIPEAVLIHHAEVVDFHFSRLRKMHVAVHLDNFGRGYASLSYLQRYPVDALKLDKSFVARLGAPGDNVGGAIVKLARDLGMGLIAEGVETQAHADQLRALDCPHAQGYLFSAPLTAGDLAALLAQTPTDTALDASATASAGVLSARRDRAPSPE
jgi:diguanylate cyclase (GGDEF)-like protein/PAS domain S-box-containing protein